MNKNRNIYLLIGLAIVIVIAGYFLLSDNFREWEYNLDKKKKNAYGTFLTYELLKNKYQKVGFTDIDKSVVESFRKLKKNKNYNYIFLNKYPYYDSVTLDTICKFAKAGNTVFMCNENINNLFSDTILVKEYHLQISINYSASILKFLDSSITSNKVTTFNFIHPKLRDSVGYNYFMLNKADTLNNSFNSFEAATIEPDDSEYIQQPIPNGNNIAFAGFDNSNNDIDLNFAVLNYGKGKFIILLTALPFTNYFMRTEKGVEYAEKVFAHLPYQTTLWDNTSQIYKPEGDTNHGNSNYGDSILYFILQNKPLRWAWYLTLLGILIYAIFHAKRRQNIIPIIEPKENNSLKYVETIGQLYFHDEEHIEIANEMRLQFLNFIRNRYYIKTNEIDDAFYKHLSLKSDIEETTIKNIFNEFNDIIKVKSINQQKLHQLNNQLENFYKTCK